MTSDQETFTIGADLLDAVISDLTEYLHGEHCDHVVGICLCDQRNRLEELRAIREHRDPWWVEMDKIESGV